VAYLSIPKATINSHCAKGGDSIRKKKKVAGVKTSQTQFTKALVLWEKFRWVRGGLARRRGRKIGH